MMELSDATLRHLRSVVDRPDLSGTRYELEEEIGRGGLGVVYAARDHQLQVRIGVHWGPVLTDGQIVSGDSVNLCARVAASSNIGDEQ